MKITARIISLVLTIVLMSSTIFMTTYAAESDMVYGIGFVNTNGLRLRSAASTTSKVIDSAPKNDCVVVLAKEGQWFKVNYNLQEGYMHESYLNVLNRENAELGYGKVIGNAVNLRSGPSTANRVVATAAKGAKCYILGLNDGWYKVIYGTNICYIRSDYLELTEYPYENQKSPNSPKFFRLGKSLGVAPSASALNGNTAYLAALLPHLFRCLLIAAGLFISGSMLHKVTWKLFSVPVLLLIPLTVILSRFTIEIPLNGEQASMTFTPATMILTALPAVVMLLIRAAAAKE